MRLRVSASAAFLRSARLSGEMRAGRGGRAHLSGVPGVASEGGVALTRRPRDCIFIEFALSSLIPDTLAQGSVESTQLAKGSVESTHEVPTTNLRKNRGGLCNASGPLGINLPDGQGPLETSPGEGGWFPRGRGLRPCLRHEAVRLSGAVGEGPPNMTQRYTFTFTFTFICHPGKTHKDTSVIEMKVRYFCQVKSEQASRQASG